MLDHELLRAVLCRVTVKDVEVEQAVKALRFTFLERMAQEQALPLDAAAPLMAAVVEQCHRTQHVYSESAAERTLVDRLIAAMNNDVPRTHNPELALRRLAVCAMYRPIWTLPGAERAFEASAGADATPLSDTLAELRREHREELEIQRDIRTLGTITDAMSASVQAHYEVHPYPRWLTLRRPAARPFAAVMAERFPDAVLPATEGRRASILVAGCGTGAHPIHVAMKYADADVTAIDLSRASLAYAIRKARQYGVANIEFRQADILGLRTLTQRFDAIECVGVLHCMRDPSEGWRVLTDLLQPRGFMKIGLYSRQARADMDADRLLLPARRAEVSPERFRALRDAMIGRARATGIPGATRIGDFYSTSGLRDLLFHVQEIEFDLPEIALLVRDLGLTFLGFRPEDALARFRARFPGGSARDLALWAQFEREVPDLFWSMYVFWTQRA